MTRIRAAAVVAALVVLAGCGGSGGRDTASLRPGPPPPTMETTVVPSPEAAPSTTTTTSGARSRGGGPSGGGGAAGGASGAGNGALAPAGAGTYAYDTTGTSTFGLSSLPFPGVTTLVVDPPAGTRQHFTRNLRDPAGNGPVQELVLDFRREGIFLENLKLTSTYSGVTNSVDLRPRGQAMFLATGSGPGSHAELNMSDGGATARVVADVVGREQVTVGGRAVDTLVITAVATMPGADVSGQVNLTYWFAPSVRLPVKERVVTDASAAGGLLRLHSEYQATLQRLP